MKYVVFYDSAPNLETNAPPHLPAHIARWKQFKERGELLMIGTFSNAQAEGSMAIFTTRAAAEAFVKDDPFVLHGVVQSWRIREWREVLWPESAQAAPASDAVERT
ncbi:MAG: hypothetical protein JO352_01685 [Chloroflexi bacterium]|nr:hypothetical protein [Chloroflexota bacterium]MBV9599035.1 hypothetical protein [Chloroflexota bacterium]